MSFEETIEELEALIVPIFSDIDSKNLTNVELSGIYGELTIFLGSVNSLDLKAKQDAPTERQNEIDKKLQQTEQLAAKAFQLLDEMLDDPARIRPPPVTGTRPKRKLRVQGVDVPPTPRPSRAQLSLPLILEQPVEETPQETPWKPKINPIDPNIETCRQVRCLFAIDFQD